MKKIRIINVAFKENNKTTDSKPETVKSQDETSMSMIPTDLLKELVSVIGKVTSDNNVEKIDTNLLANAIVDGFAMREGNRNGVLINELTLRIHYP